MGFGKVLNLLSLVVETLFREARKLNELGKKFDPEDYIPNLEERIKQLRDRSA